VILYDKIEPSFQKEKGELKELTKVVTLGELFSKFLKLNKNKNGGKYFLKFIITIFFHVSLVFSGK